MRAVLFFCLVTSAVGASINGGFPDIFGGAFNFLPAVPTMPAMTAKHWFCHDLDCPAFATLVKTSGYEKRRYEAIKWVATNVTSDSYPGAETHSLFQKLFDYIQGSNSLSQKIPMTIPVLKRHIPGATPEAPQTSIMYFMVPHDMWASTPDPTDPSVYLVTLPPMTVYVKSYAGYGSYGQDEEMLNSLRAEIGTTPFNTQYTLAATYDGPYTLTKRHNEVWIPE